MKHFPWLLLILFLASCNTLYFNLKRNPDRFTSGEQWELNRGYPLIFRDEFDQHSLSPYWKQSMYWSGPLFHPEFPSTGYYSPANVTFTDSTIRLWTRYEPRTFFNERTGDSVRIDYSLGLLDLYPWISQGNDLVNDFMVECRAKMPDGDNEWPAFWLTGYKQWPPEIDIFEFWKDSIGQFTTNFHYLQDDKHRQDHKKHKIPPDLKNDFHVYGLKITGSEMIFYFDGFPFRRLKGVEPYLHKFTVVINNGVHDEPLNDTFLEVDWIRIYRLK